MAKNHISTLEAQIRDIRGSQAAKHLRQSGRVPAVLYHSNDDKSVTSIALDFDEKDIRNLVSSRPTLIQVSWGTSEDESRECVLRELQRHPVNQLPVHLDLLAVKRGVMMESTIQVRLIGTPIGVKDQGGVLQQNVYELSVRCMPMDLINELVYDVSEMNLYDAIHIEDIKSETLEILEESDRTVASVVMPRALVTAEDEEAEEAEEGEEGEEGVEGEEGEEGAKPDQDGGKGSKE